MLEKTRAGQVIAADGSEIPNRLGRHSSQADTDSHAGYGDSVGRGNCFVASTQSHVNFGVALTATAVTLTLYNPNGSGKNLVLLEAAATVSGTVASSIVYAVNDVPGQAIPTATTALVVRNAQLGTAGGTVAQVFSVATLPAAPVAVRSMFSWTATNSTGQSPRSFIDKIDGRLILTPNTAVTLQGVGSVGGIIGIMSMVWEEVFV